MGAYQNPSSSAAAISAGFTSFKTGRWYKAYRGRTAAATTSNLALNTTYFLPVSFPGDVNISDVAAYISVLGGNIQLAIYANDPTTDRPTGLPMLKTGNIDVSSTGAKNAGTIKNGADATVASVAFLKDVLYWVATTTDNIAVRLQSLASTTIEAAANIGSTTLANITGGAGLSQLTFVVAATTFGTFGDMTSATFTEDNSTARGALLHYKAA